jgi:hypothetical protein
MKSKKNTKINLKNKKVVLTLDQDFFPTQKNAELTKAAKKVVKDIRKHFKNDKWPLDFNFLVEEVFYEAFNEHLSNYLLKELYSKPENFKIVYQKDKTLLLAK